MTLQYTYTSLCSHQGIGPILHTNISSSPPQATSPRPCSHQTIPLQTLIPVSLTFPCPFCNLALQPAPSRGSGVLAILYSTAHSFPDKWRVLRLCDFKDLTVKDWEMGGGEKGCRHVAWIARPVGRVEVGDDGETSVGVGWKKRTGGDGAETKFEGLLQRLRGLGV